MGSLQDKVAIIAGEASGIVKSPILASKKTLHRPTLKVSRYMR